MSDILKDAISYVQEFIKDKVVNIGYQPYVRIDSRNSLIVYNPSTCPTRFVEVVSRFTMSVSLTDEKGIPTLYTIVSEEDFEDLELGRVPFNANEKESVITDYIRDFIKRKVVNREHQRYVRIDNRNRFAVYNSENCPARFVDAVSRHSIKVLGDYSLISEEQWSGMDLGRVPYETDASYFDEDYYRPSLKNCNPEYKWNDFWPERAGEIADTFQPKSFLDIGCARGFLLKAVGMRGIAIQGIDISHWAIDHCEPEVADKVRQFDLHSAEPLPFADISFDVVHSEQVMEHIKEESLLHCFKEMYRVSKKWVLIGVPLGYSNISQPWGEASHKSFFCAGWWIKVAHEAGLLFDWRYSKFHAYKAEGCVWESADFVFVKDRLDRDCPWDKLEIKVANL